MRTNVSDREYESLSAYMDGQLSPGEQRRLEERLRAQPELQVALDELQRTRTLLRQAPRRRAPRSFVLTPAMVGEPRRRTSRSWNLFPVFGFTSALAALALIAVIVLQLASGAAAPQQTIAMMEPPVSPEMNATGAFDSAAEDASRAAVTEPAAPEAALMAEATPAAKGAPEGETVVTVPPVILWSNTQTGGAPDTAYGMGGGGGGDGSADSIGDLISPPPAPKSANSANTGAGSAVPNADNMVLPIQSAPGEEMSSLAVEPTATGELPPSDRSRSQAPESTEPAPTETAPTEAAPTAAAGEPVVPQVNDAPKVEEPAEADAGGSDTPEPLPTPQPTATPTEAAASLQDSISGTGPILGVPAADEGGQIVEKKAILGQTEEAVQPEPSAPQEEAVQEEPAVQGEPVQEEPLTGQSEPASTELTPGAETVAPATGVEHGAAPAAAQARTVLGLDPAELAALQIGLAALAVAAGVAAFLMYRRRNG